MPQSVIVVHNSPWLPGGSPLAVYRHVPALLLDSIPVATFFLRLSTNLFGPEKTAMQWRFVQVSRSLLQPDCTLFHTKVSARRNGQRRNHTSQTNLFSKKTFWPSGRRKFGHTVRCCIRVPRSFFLAAALDLILTKMQIGSMGYLIIFKMLLLKGRIASSMRGAW